MIVEIFLSQVSIALNRIRLINILNFLLNHLHNILNTLMNSVWHICLRAEVYCSLFLFQSLARPPFRLINQALSIML